MKMLEISLRTKFIDNFGKIITVYTYPDFSKVNCYCTDIHGGEYDGIKRFSKGIVQARSVHKKTIDYASRLNPANIFKKVGDS